jgi:RNA polymerase sigma-70 factor, ECF subfamily
LLDENLASLFQSWLIEHKGVVVKVARAYTLTTEDCQDLAQEILLQVWRSLPQFQGRASASTWLYRVALNTALSWRR